MCLHLDFSVSDCISVLLLQKSQYANSKVMLGVSAFNGNSFYFKKRWSVEDELISAFD